MAHILLIWYLKEDPTEFHTDDECPKVVEAGKDKLCGGQVNLGVDRFTTNNGTRLNLCRLCSKSNPVVPRI